MTAGVCKSKQLEKKYYISFSKSKDSTRKQFRRSDMMLLSGCPDESESRVSRTPQFFYEAFCRFFCDILHRLDGITSLGDFSDVFPSPKMRVQLVLP
jgi:hypothetical protein